MIFYTELDSPIGPILACASERGVRGLYFEQHKHFAGPQSWRRDDDMPLLHMVRMQIEQYFRGTRRAFSIPLDLVGTPFQMSVWRALSALPFGHTATYRSIAQAVGNPVAVRAVGSAIGRNPASIVVPCHRVLNSVGGLSGYAGGLARKEFLLKLEGNGPR